MNTYYSTFFAGGGEFVEQFLREDTKSNLLKVWDGLIEYNCDLPSEQLSSLVYLRNSGGETWEKLAKASGERRLTYRLMFYDRNKPMAVDRRVLDMPDPAGDGSGRYV